MNVTYLTYIYDFFSYLYNFSGYFLGYVFYIALESYGVLTLKDFLNFWAVIFLIATSLVAIFKQENDQQYTPDTVSLNLRKKC